MVAQALLEAVSPESAGGGACAGQVEQELRRNAGNRELQLEQPIRGAAGARQYDVWIRQPPGGRRTGAAVERRSWSV